MHDSVLVHMLQSACNLVNVLPNAAFRKGNVFFNRSLDNQLQVAFLHILDGNEQLIKFVVDKPIEVLHNVRMV